MTSITLPRSKTAQGVAYHRSGDHGAPVVLVHGVGLRAESWFQQIEALGADYRVYAVDICGERWRRYELPGDDRAASITPGESPGLTGHRINLTKS